MLKIFDRYILKEVFPPFLIGLLVTAFVLLMNQVLVLAELFIDRGVPAGVAARLFVFLVPSLLAFAVPMAVLAGIMGGLARLSADSEIVAFRTLGIGSRSLVRPLLLFALGGWLVTSALTLVLAPRANFRWVQDMTSSSWPGRRSGSTRSSSASPFRTRSSSSRGSAGTSNGRTFSPT